MNIRANATCHATRTPNPAPVFVAASWLAPLCTGSPHRALTTSRTLYLRCGVIVDAAYLRGGQTPAARTAHARAVSSFDGTRAPL